MRQKFSVPSDARPMLFDIHRIIRYNKDTMKIISYMEDERVKTTLVIMAAGIGSRFGGGIKQLQPVGPNGEIIMDYSIRDAAAAGFDKVVFIIRKDLEKDFKDIIGNRIEKEIEVGYAFQELDDLPEGYEKPEGRTKPWGTGQAILVCKDIVKEPFVVINADDYYGKEAFVKLHDFLLTEPAYADGKLNLGMAGFILGNTLSENGAVTRGICAVDGRGYLTDVIETKGIEKTADGAVVKEEGKPDRAVDAGSHVSMNMWALSPEFMDVLEKGFAEFLEKLEPGDLKSEYLLPIIIDGLIKSGKAQVQLRETNDKWYGITYKEDIDYVKEAFKTIK